MGKHLCIIVPILSSVFFIITTLEVVHTVSVSIPGNARALRSVTIHRRSPNDESPSTNLLLSPDKHNTTMTPVIAQRKTSEIGGGSTFDAGDGSNDGVGDFGNGTLSNSTVSSRLQQNGTEPCSLDPSSLCSSEQTDSKWDRQRRIAHIVNFLWTNVFGNRTRPVNKEVVRERYSPLNPSSSSFSGGLQSISASCDLPSEVESEAWSTERYFSLFFNLSSQYSDILGKAQNSENFVAEQQSQSLGSGQSKEYVAGPLISTFSATPKKIVNVISAKLRLYKVGSMENVNVETPVEIEPSEPCNDTKSTSGSDEVVPSVLPTRMTFPELSPSSDEKIRVSVFWYTQPATKNHYKKRLLDAKMLSVRESRWIEFDVKNAVKAWLNDRKPNFGIVIEVENENQDALNPRNYFRTTPCFVAQSEQISTIADIQSNSGQQTGDNGRQAATPSSAPVLEICTLNVAETTTNYEQTNFFPYSLNPESLSHLKRVALSHAKANNASESPSSNNSTKYPWQTINLNGLSPVDFDSDSGDIDRSEIPKPTVVVLNHKHRHHHERNSVNGNTNEKNFLLQLASGATTANTQPLVHQPRNKSRFSQSQPRGLSLDPDHPLREILASVNGNSKETIRRGSSAISSQQFPESLGRGHGSNIFAEMPADDSNVGGDDYSDSVEQDVFITKIVIAPAQLKESDLLKRIASKGQLSSAAATTDSTNSDMSDR